MNQSDLLQFKEAVVAAQEGHKLEAHRALSGLLTRNPQMSELLLWHAFTAPDVTTAKRSIDRAAALRPDDPSLAVARDWLALQKMPPVPIRSARSYRRLGIVAVALVLIGLVVLVAPRLADTAATYVRYDSVENVVRTGQVGDYVAVPFETRYVHTDIQFVYDTRGLLVKAPDSGFKSGPHVYYLRLVQRSELPVSDVFSIGPSSKALFLVAEVIRIE
jgi:hypothetical protein